MHPSPFAARPATPPVARPDLLILAPALALLAYAFWPTLELLVAKWSDDPQYSHGFLVPLFSAYLVWRAYQNGKLRIGRSWPVVGVAVLVLAVLARWVAGGTMFRQLDCAALLVSLVGLALIAGGRVLAVSLLPAIGFLWFAVDLPHDWERNVGGPLKTFATEASTYLLQTMGYPAIAEGNTILIDEVKLGIIDACSGLKMLVTFSAFAAGAILTLDRTMFEKGLIALGVVPIAVLVNVLRITATGVAYTVTDSEPTRHFLHDLHGWLMMPGGLALLGVELWALTRLVAPATKSAYA